LIRLAGAKKICIYGQGRGSLDAWEQRIFNSMKIIRKKQLYLPALSILLVVVLLLIWITLSTYRNFDRDREKALYFVRQQGFTLMHALESGIRAGVAGPRWSEEFIRRLIEETGKNHAIAYIYIYDGDGKVMYHSLPSMVDVKTAWTPELDGRGDIKTRVRNFKDGSRVYDLAKPFMSPDVSFPAGNNKKPEPGLKGHPPKGGVLVLGMNLTAFDEARQADLHHAVIMGAIVIALGVGALFFLFVIQNYYLVDKKLEKSRDYTKQAEERAKQAEKLAAVGKLASGVAHEIRNPLSSIRGFAQYLSRFLTGHPREKEYADIMVKEVDRINGVVSDLLTLSRPGLPELVSTDIFELVTHAVRLVADDAKSRNIKIVKDIPLDMKGVRLDANQITQVLLNLLLNAVHALETDGSIEIGVHQDLPREKIMIWVTDDGPGVLPDMGEKIFDPFVTTREEGNGLGLTIVRTIVENHGGKIGLESPLPGKDSGSRFVIELPDGHL
jgi:signal transduction histidine kinase